MVGIGIVLTPLTLTFQVTKLYYEEINIDYFYYYFNESSQYYEPLKGYYVIITNFGNMFLIVASIFLIILFFQKKSSFRIYYTGYRIFNVVFLIIDLIMIYTFAGTPVSSEDKILINGQTAAVTRMVVQACIWIPYIWLSERSRHTFVTDSDGKTNTPQLD